MGDPLTWYEALRKNKTRRRMLLISSSMTWPSSARPRSGSYLLTPPPDAWRRFFKGTAAPHDDAKRDLQALSPSKTVSNQTRSGELHDCGPPPQRRRPGATSCELGSVNVTELCALESFATVHQLVTTVEGTASTSTVDVVRNAFPPGRMTSRRRGGPARFLDDLEGRARGCYAGCLGFFGFDGSADLNVPIRTAVLSGLNSKPDWTWRRAAL